MILKCSFLKIFLKIKILSNPDKIRPHFKKTRFLFNFLDFMVIKRN